MLYRFKSQATGDLVMLRGDAEAALRLMGKPVASQGIFSTDQLQAAIAVLRAAATEDRAIRKLEMEAYRGDQAGDLYLDPDIRLSQRIVPLIALLEEASRGDRAVIWSAA
jgi:hypothetical protein